MHQVRGIGRTYDTIGTSPFAEIDSLQTQDVNISTKQDKTHSVYFEDPDSSTGEGKRFDTPVFKLDTLDVGDKIKGPAVIIDETQTIVLDPRSEAVVTSQHLFITLL